MQRRRFLGALAAIPAAITAKTASAEPPPHVQFSHVAYGFRPDGRLGPYVEWRNAMWWIDEIYGRGVLRWFSTTTDDMVLNFIALPHPIQQIAPDRDRLWLLTPAGWCYFTYDSTPFDDSARITKA